MRYQRALYAWMVASVGLWIAGCTPTLNWRDVAIEGGDGAMALFPCKPKTQRRTLQLASESVAALMLTCETAGQTFAVLHFRLNDPSHVTMALQALQRANIDNTKGVVESAASAPVTAGVTAHPLAGRSRVKGTRPDGAAVLLATQQRVHGTYVFQSSVLGKRVDDAAIDVFFDGLLWNH